MESDLAMSDFGNYTAVGAKADTALDPGLKKFMLGVYQKMGLGLVLSAVLAWLTSSYAPISDLLYVKTPTGALAGFTLFGLIISFAPLVILLGSNFLMKSASPRSAAILYWVIVALVGASLGTVVLMYTGASVATTFLVTAAAFGGLSLAGYTTKRDLSGVRSFVFFAMWGFVFAGIAFSLGGAFGLFSVGPIFMIMNAVGILLMAGLIASETQNLKMLYYSLRGDDASLNVATSMGALNLYVSFVNLFRFLLYFMGGRR
jgi:FtsH-binding integral membrane protein